MSEKRESRVYLIGFDDVMQYTNSENKRKKDKKKNLAFS